MFICFRYGFGAAGNAKYNIPGGATLQYKIKLTAFEKVNRSDTATFCYGGHGPIICL